MRKVIISILLCFTGSFCFSQNSYFYGRVLDSITQLPVQDVQVEDDNIQASDYTNIFGLFLLKASPLDSLSLVHVGYYSRQLRPADQIRVADTIIIYLVPKTRMLESVTVSAYDYSDYQADSVDRRRFFEQTIGYAHPLFQNSNSGSGIALGLDRIFGSKQKNKKRAFKLLAEVEKEKYVSYRYNDLMVHSYTGLKGDQLQTFITKTLPSFDWLRAHPTQLDIMYYINDELKRYYPRKN